MTAAAAIALPDAFDPGPRPELAWLPVDKLHVDQSYQRTIEGRVSQAAIAKIADNFRWSCFGVVMAAKRAIAAGGGWLIIDGQHRVEAARRRELELVPCVVVPAGTTAEQAQIFLATNETRVRINPYAIHHARVAAGDPEAIDGAALARKAGIEIPRYPIPRDKLKPGQTMALGTILKAAGDPRGTLAVLLVGQAWAARASGIPATVLRAAWRALDDGVPQDNVKGWLRRNEAGYFAPAATVASIEALAHAMRRAQPLAHVVSGIDPKRLMGAR